MMAPDGFEEEVPREQGHSRGGRFRRRAGEKGEWEGLPDGLLLAEGQRQAGQCHSCGSASARAGETLQNLTPKPTRRACLASSLFCGFQRHLCLIRRPHVLCEVSVLLRPGLASEPHPAHLCHGMRAGERAHLDGRGHGSPRARLWMSSMFSYGSSARPPGLLPPVLTFRLLFISWI